MRHAPTLAVLLLVACGGDNAGPTPVTYAYPAVAGVYAVTATFDGFSSAVAMATGTLVLNQPDRNVATLSGTADLTSNINGSITHISGLNNPSVTTQGVLSFSVGASASATWVFTGNATGTALAGRHTLSGGNVAFSGDWSGTRSGSARTVGQRRSATPNEGDAAALLRQLRR